MIRDKALPLIGPDPTPWRLKDTEETMRTVGTNRRLRRRCGRGVICVDYVVKGDTVVTAEFSDGKAVVIYHERKFQGFPSLDRDRWAKEFLDALTANGIAWMKETRI